MLQTCKDVVSFGEVEKETVALLLSKRGKSSEGKKLSGAKKPEEIAKLASEIASGGKKLSEYKVQPIFSLSPPKGGFGARKMPVPFGPVGKNAKIAQLIASMA
jgi:large subunit ribosomal protein L30